MELVRHIKKNEGVLRGFYKGISLNFFKGPLAVGTSLSVKNIINRNVDKNYDKWKLHIYIYILYAIYICDDNKTIIVLIYNIIVLIYNI